MNANTIINMVLRMFMRQVVGRGINAGIDMATKKMGKSNGDPAADRQQSAAGREMASRAKQAVKIGRRAGRF